jgi:hypothetical protein
MIDTDTNTINGQEVEILPPLPPQHEGYMILRQQGINKSNAAEMVGYSRPYSQHLDQKFNKYLISGNTKLLKLAHTNVKNMLSEDAPTKDSSRVALVNMIYDRHDPVIRHNQNVNLNVDCTPIDVDRWKR